MLYKKNGMIDDESIVVYEGNNMNYRIPKDIQEYIVHLADAMAASSTSFTAHNYDIFINSRDNLKKLLETVELMKE